ncbi:MFS transporter [Microlunatus flavus]|uniref:Fucose permease n=1 Tax=Microlunatus flavus TaxID=1036181 RepID=A0A1H9C633_9ACTN|nr:MFS transporter [Microlunatus flavus]SEP96725.1 Fucose permease [Microlunatus flavus]
MALVQTVPLDARTIRRWRNAIMTAFAIGGIAVSTWGPRLPQLRADLGVDNAAIGLVLAGVTVGSVGGLSVAAPLLARLGSRRGIGTMLWLIAAAVAVIGTGAGLAHSVVVTTLGFVLVGFAIGSVDVMINVDGAEVERAAGRTWMPLMHAAWSAGAIVGAGIGAGCAALGIALQWQFLGEAVLIATAGVVATRFVPVREPAGAASEREPVAVRIRTWLRGWSDARLLLIGVVMLGVELGEGTANSWLTLAVRDGHRQTDAVAALFFAAFAASETVARVAGGPLVDRIGRVRAVQLTTALGVAGLLAFILAGPVWLVLVGIVLWAFGVSLGFPLGMSAAADSGPNPAARVSVVASIGYLANLGGPPAIGFVSESVGLLNALWLVLALMLVALVLARALRRPGDGMIHRDGTADTDGPGQEHA